MNKEVKSYTFNEISEEEYDSKIKSYPSYEFEASSYFKIYEQNQKDRKIFGYFEFYGGGYRSILCLGEYRAKKMNFLWARSAPVWNKKPSRDVEEIFIKQLEKFVRNKSNYFDYIRLRIYHDYDFVKKENVVLSYDKTVVINLGENLEDTYSKIYKRGRRDLRKAIREAKFKVNDESNISRKDFSDVYKIMEDTKKRHDGFAILSEENYWKFFNSLKDKKSSGYSKLFTIRDEHNDVLSWAIVIVYDDFATYYFAASNKKGQQNFGPDLIIAHILDYLQNETKVRSLDLMGIGSEYHPSLKSLNTFKTKFSKDIIDVPVYKEIVIHKSSYYTKLFMSKAKNKIIRM